MKIVLQICLFAFIIFFDISEVHAVETEAFSKCVKKNILDILQIILITVFTSFIVEKGFHEITQRIPTGHTRQTIQSIGDTIANIIIPSVGAILIIINLAVLFDACIAELFELDSLIEWIINVYKKLGERKNA